MNPHLNLKAQEPGMPVSEGRQEMDIPAQRGHIPPSSNSPSSLGLSRSGDARGTGGPSALLHAPTQMLVSSRHAQNMPVSPGVWASEPGRLHR